MSGTTGSGVAVGLATAEQGPAKGGGGLSMYNLFPKLIIPVIIYAAVAWFANLDADLFNVGLPSGEWSLSTGDLILTVALIFLFLEMIQSAGSSTSTLLNNGLSMGLFVVCLMLFLLVPTFATSVFFLITLMTLIDSIAGVTITAIAARRDLGT
jgi:hypothetical protein